MGSHFQSSNRKVYCLFFTKCWFLLDHLIFCYYHTAQNAQYAIIKLDWDIVYHNIDYVSIQMIGFSLYNNTRK